MIGRNTPEEDKKVNWISYCGNDFMKKTLKKKSNKPVLRKFSRIFKNITVTEESDENKSESTDIS